MKKLLVLALGLFLVACGQYTTPEEGTEEVPAVEVEGEAMMQEESVMSEEDVEMPEEGEEAMMEEESAE
ncbi:hypothetical protein K9L63_00230 [Candidatus Gracilibacteria bacterium]|nr:hypothetical protein [Candidatus Gracilibacteria bacterium]